MLIVHGSCSGKPVNQVEGNNTTLHEQFAKRLFLISPNFLAIMLSNETGPFERCIYVKYIRNTVCTRLPSDRVHKFIN